MQIKITDCFYCFIYSVRKVEPLRGNYLYRGPFCVSGEQD